ncbi:hypothetical protein SAMN05421821_10844 [Mucilaginibacter lappiensis]|uniref:Uncharacterized protein n=1 Tax=Mucilaginibacter lappiensis TaxID=354630 RepID=A0ABR6PK52_9SPHI|nr:hypothetical protein [Mucilaginibacter lappiensis]MBB6110149.1 hypothetical protein [Mucilaginibacter lappiensis]SIR51700.1 hypothetical protein SAMN05421821_10844 [Mucilaginibacter lappiensis]
MHKIKFLFLAVIVAVSTSACSQNNKTVLLKWKLDPKEVITYKTIMVGVDTADKKLDMSGLTKAMGLGDAVNWDDLQKMLKKLNANLQPGNMVATLAEKRKGIIDIELITKNDDKQDTASSTLSEAEKMFKQMSTGVQLRGTIHEDGTIKSFYLKSEQKNIIALLFKLPGKSIKQGDSWPLSVNLLTADQNFKCDSSYRKNLVTAVKIENINGEQIFTLKYDIVEYIKGDFTIPSPMGAQTPVKTVMSMSYQGIAKFSVDKGRWVAYDGLLSYNSSGVMTANTKMKYSLVEE